MDDFLRTTAVIDWDVVTCAASDALARGSGFCYANSHLLAALVPANGIPAGFCYQRLKLDPASIVVGTLRAHTSATELYKHLPDVLAR